MLPNNWSYLWSWQRISPSTFKHGQAQNIHVVQKYEKMRRYEVTIFEQKKVNKYKNNSIEISCGKISNFLFSSDLYCVHCDLSSLESVRNCANEIKSKEKRIDGLVNNAGVLLDPKPATKDGIETHWSVNHLGHYLLTRLLIDELELGGRVLFATNLDARKAYDGIDYNLLDDKTGKNKKYAFYQSQLANQMMIKSLSTELKPRFITVNGVYPGAVLETDFRQNVVYNLEKGFGYFLFICKKDQAIKTMLHMLVSKDMIGTTGKQFWNMNEMAFSSGASHEKEEKLKLIDDYFCGLKSREEISKLIGINENKETAL